MTSARRGYRLLAAAVRKSRRGIKTRVTRGAQGLRRQVGTAAATGRAELLFGQALDELAPDVIHAHDFVTLPAAARAAQRLGALCIYDSHELEMHRNIRRGRFDRWLCGRIERRHIRQADAVVTVCDSIADHLARAYAIPRPEVVMNAPDVGSLAPIGRDVRSDLGLSPDTPLAIYVGRITIGRGIERLAQALAHMPGTHLALLGAVNAPTLVAATEIVRENGTADRFHPLPPVPPSAVLPYIASADVSVVPIENVCLSYFYCLPNKLIESTIAGLPVVVSDFPEMRRYVELGRCGLTMDPEDPADIARAVSEAYRRRFELRFDAERRARVEESYGWETQRQRLVELYEHLWLERRHHVRTAAG